MAQPNGDEPRSSVNSGSTVTDSRPQPRIRPPRSLPRMPRLPPSQSQSLTSRPLAWISSYEERYGRPSEDQLGLLNPPPPPKLPQHNNTPSEPRRRTSRDGYVDWSIDPASDDDYHKKIKVPRLKKGQSRGRK